MAQFDMATAQALDTACKMDLGFSLVDKCWDICYASRVERAQLVSGQIPDATVSAMNKCGTKCINRYFEAMELMVEARMNREREQAGLQ